MVPRNALTAGTRLGRFRVESEIGRGGMGVVYRARDEETGEPVALKLLLAELGHDLELVARVEREARAAAVIRHPNVARLVFTGAIEGQRVLAFELVPGGSLADRLKEGPLPWREAASLGVGIARALEAVHAAGLVHRDLKPANVLLATNGQPKLTDFGLVRTLSGRTRLTQTGEVLGTPSYMAPEQLDSAKDTGPEADVYSLGATLYALLAGRPPFEGSGVVLMKKVLADRPRPVRELVPGVPASLGGLVSRLLDKDPAARGDAASVAGELEAIARGEAGSSSRGRRLFAAGVAAIGLAIAIAWWARDRRPQDGTAPEVGPLTSKTITPPSLPGLAYLDPDIASQLRAQEKGWRIVSGYGDARWKHAGNVRSVAFLPGGRLVAGAEDATVRIWDLDRGTYVPLVGPRQPVLCLAASSDGALVAAGGNDPAVFVWDLAHPDTPRRIDVSTTGSPFGLAFSRERTLYVATTRPVSRTERRSSIRAFLRGESAPIASAEAVPTDIRAITLAADGKKIYAACGDGKVRWWDAATLENPGESRTLHDGPVTALALSADGKRALTGSEPRASSAIDAPDLVGTRLWDLPGWTESEIPLDDRKKPSYAVAFSHDGALAVASDMDGTIRLVDVKGSHRDAVLRCPGGWPDTIAFEPGTDRFVAGCWGAIDVWDAREPSGPLNRKTDAQRASGIKSVAASSDGKRVVVATGLDRGVSLLDLSTGAALGHATLDDYCQAVAFAADGTVLAADRALVVYRFRPDGLAPVWSSVVSNNAVAERVTSLVFSGDGKSLLGTLDQPDEPEVVEPSFKTWLVPAHPADEPSAFVRPDSAKTAAIAMSKDGTRSVTGHRDHRVRFWTLDRPVATHVDGGNVEAVAISPGGKLYAWGGSEQRVHIIERSGSSETELASPPMAKSWIVGLAFSPDEGLLAVSSHDGAVRVWSVKRSEVLATIDLGVVGDASSALAFANDHELLVGTERGLVLAVSVDR